MQLQRELSTSLFLMLPGFGDCNNAETDGCEAPLTTSSNCGACGQPCSLDNAQADCSTGTCALVACNQGFGNCDGNAANGCETALDAIPNCGACSNKCDLVVNATPKCVGGACDVDTCDQGYGNCDGNGANGCETQLTTSSNCGACGQPCSRTNAQADCSTGTCTLVACNQGFGNCDGNDANGCETPLNTLTNCGRCGNACTNPASSCVNGACTVATTATTPDAATGACNTSSLTRCGVACVNTATDPSNCGACGVKCATGSTCQAGVCTPKSTKPPKPKATTTAGSTDPSATGPNQPSTTTGAASSPLKSFATQGTNATDPMPSSP